MNGSESVAAARRIAALPSPEARRAALAEIPPDFQDLVRQTATNLRAVALHWMKRAEGGLPLSQIPPAVRETIEELFPGALGKV